MRYLLLLLLLPSFVMAETITIESVSVQNPRIVVTYTEDVFLLSAGLIGQDPGNTIEYTLRQLPQKNPSNPAYVKKYELFTGTNAEPQYLLDGRYQLTLEAITADGQGTFDIVDFVVHGLEIRLLNPPFGLANSNPFTVYFGTFIDDTLTSTECRYSSTATAWNSMTSLGSNTDFTIDGLNYNGYLNIRCREASGRETYQQFTVGFDVTPPVITAIANPDNITDPQSKETFILVTTDEPSVCTIDGQYFEGESRQNENSYRTTRDHYISYESITDLLEHNFEYEITCTDRAGWQRTTTVNVTVNFGVEGTIIVLNPPQTLTTNTFDLRVQTTFDADSCTVNDEVMNKADNIFDAPFTDVQDGESQFEIACTGRKDETITYTIDIDSEPPEMTHLSASQVLCDNTISAAFTATDNIEVVSYTYKAIDDNGILGVGTTIQEGVTLTLERPIVGGVSWEVYATDPHQQNSPLAFADIPDFRNGGEEECGRPPFITLVDPEYGFAIANPYIIELATTRTATCRYALQSGVAWSDRTPFDSTDQRTHTKAFTFDDQELHVWCTEPDGTNHTETFRIGYDATPPFISVEAVPNPVIDPAQKVVIMTVRTTDPAYCTYNNEPFTAVSDQPETYTNEHVATLDFRSITDPQPQNKQYDIACQNLAGLPNEVPYIVHINLGTGMQVELLEPGPYTADDPVTMRVRVNFDAACTYTPTGGSPKSFDAVEGKIHTALLGSLDDGTHQYTLDCISATESKTSIVSFIVDKSIPGIEDLSGPAAMCRTSMYNYTITGLDSQITVAYTLEGPVAVMFEDTTGNPFIIIDRTGLIPGTYTLTLTPENRAGTTGTPVAKTITVLPPAACITDPCTNGVKDGNEVDIDCGGSCPACLSCTADSDCAPNICENNVCVRPPVDLCKNSVKDDGEEGVDCGGSCPACIECAANIECLSGVCTVEGSCLPNPINHCENNVQDADEIGVDCGGSCAVCAPPEELCTNGVQDTEEDDVDCGGSCPACVECTANIECASGVCTVAGSCLPDPSDHCVNGVLDGNEEHVDCGGFCLACVSCTSNDDCGAKECVNSVCLPPPPPPCENGVKDTDELGVDCGGSCAACTTCTENTQCVSGVCTIDGSCLPHEEDLCANGIEDPGEEGVDCGGTCDACKDCTASDTCESGICTADNTCIPVPADPCKNNKLDPGEQKIDCGGSCSACIECTTNTDCIIGTCNIAGACTQDPVDVCENGILDSGEEFIDCGGSCAPCFSCILDIECADDEHCVASVCAPLPAPDLCANHIQDPGEEGVDCGGSCPVCAPCIDDLDCGFDICVAGLCEPEPVAPVEPIPENPTPAGGCTSNFECAVDEECSGGSCVFRSSSERPPARGNAPVGDSTPQSNEGISWMALVLVVLGVVIMGGSGYFLYEQHNAKKSTPTQPPPRMPPRMTPPGARPPVQQTAPVQPQQRNIEEKEWKSRSQERHKLFESFGDKKSPAPERVEPKKPKEKEDGVFDELDKL
ncbi:MAG: hypothetical protein OXR66_06090 [Candidatus Woesearchaeota archaeon]|nr:hypothetical protein [Candidatus Woesearchaeota archaeon]